MDLDRESEEHFRTAVDQGRIGPGQQQKDGVRLEIARALDRLREIAIKRLTARRSWRVRWQRRQEAASHDADADSPGFVTLDEGADLLTGADQKRPLSCDKSRSARIEGGLDQQIAQEKQDREGRDVIQDEPATRVDDRGLGKERQDQEAQTRNVPKAPCAGEVWLQR